MRGTNLLLKCQFWKNEPEFVAEICGRFAYKCRLSDFVCFPLNLRSTYQLTYKDDLYDMTNNETKYWRHVAPFFVHQF